MRRHIVFLAAALLAVGGIQLRASAEEKPAWPGIGVMKGTERGYVATPMGQVHYQARGEGTPVLLLHQTPWFSVQFTKVLPYFAARGFRAIAPDRPGFGLSDVPDAPPTIEDYAENLVHVLDGLGYSKVAVVGHNTGSSVAAAFAHRHPERVAQLALHSTPLYTAEEKAERLARPHWQRWLEDDGAHLAENFSSRGSRMPDGVGLESVQWSVLSFFLAGETEWYGHEAAFSYDMATALREISVPTFVMVYERDALFSQTRRVKTLRPDFAYQEFPGGHVHFTYDEPDVWASSVLEWLEPKIRAD